MKNKFYIFWHKHSKKILLIGAVTLLATAIFPQLSFAEEAPPTSGDLEEIYNSITNLLVVALEFLQRILWPILLLIGGLMKNDILFDAGMEDLMITIWANVRNIVNILMVLVLLAIAFYNVMGLGQNYHIKTILPKFIIALIAVNFSYLAVKVILDSVNVVSTAIFAMPNAVKVGLGDTPFSTAEKEEEVCRSFYGKQSAAAYQAAVKAAGDTALCTDNFEKPTFTKNAKRFFASFDGNNAGIVMAINLAKINNLEEVKKDVNASVKNLALNMLFSVTFYVVYATAFVALFVVLLARLVVLWISIVLSPLAVLPFVLPEKLKSSLGEAGKLQEAFVKHAIVPIPIALVMTIGFIMLDGLQKSKFPAISNLTANTLGINFLSSGLTTLQEVIVAVGMVGVVWTGVFAAAGNTIAKSVTDGIKGVVGRAGKFLATSWQYAPLFPTTTGEGKPISLAGIGEMMKEIPLARDKKARDEGRKAYERITGQKANTIGDELEKTRDYPSAQQGLANAKAEGATAASSKPVQRGLARAMDNSLETSSKIMASLPSELKDTNGTKFDKKELKKKLEDGLVGERTMMEIIELHTKGKQPVTAKTTEPTKPGEAPPAAAGAAIAATQADNILNLGTDAEKGMSVYEQALGSNLKHKGALDKYRASRAGTAQDAALKEAQETLGHLDSLQSEGFFGADSVSSKAAEAANIDALNKIIEDRRNVLKEKHGIADSTVQDTILRVELDPFLKRTTEDQDLKTEFLSPAGAAAKAIFDNNTVPSPAAKVEHGIAPAGGGGGKKSTHDSTTFEM